MVLKRQNGMQRGRAVILAACICTGWVRLSGCLLGRGKVGKNIAEFWPIVPLGASPVCPARSSALNASSVLLQVRGKQGFLAGGGWAVAACEEMQQTRFGARALPVGTGAWWGGGRSSSSLYFTFSVSHHSCTPFSVLSPLLS